VISIFVDADGCPVKNEIYRVAERHSLNVFVVANSRMRVPENGRIELVVVPGEFDAADDWIVERAGPGDIVVSADIPLASRCLGKGARVLDPRGGEFREDSIGDMLATRELLSHMRDLGAVMGGPAPFEKQDRSRFLHRLDETIRQVLRQARQ